ncbi:YhgE/Pip domain-containing protein [Bacillus sp. 165]|uniref:YhgE/Pip domain-containing protein n=1 Tax=Bacillus sp. 165 TaxID=1529117 RepID=UPI001AD96D4B|nr:YhgE/Pip domain-containing protein [Bacillus sp. 165]MBO9131395.1 YhgE/Pip domain-containing protein [Bacillus sp. 165]
MKKIIIIYTTDIKRILTNWAVSIVVIGLMVLPSLYAWFNIESSWDPYSNTKGIAIAVTNEDKGAIIKDKAINLGNEVVDSLKKSTSLGWKFVNKKEAIHGVKQGTYYASIIIPKDFSKKIATVLNEEPIKAELVYYVNEKINAIAPKITSKGASGIIAQVSQNFIKAASETIFKAFNELGIELQQELPTIEKVKELVFRLEASLPELKHTVNTAIVYGDKAQDILKVLQDNLPLLTQVVTNSLELSNDLLTFLNKTGEVLATVSPSIKQDLILLRQTTASIEQLTDILLDANTDPAYAKQILTIVIERLNSGISLIDSTIQVLQSINNLTPNDVITAQIDVLNNVKNNFQTQRDLMQTALDAINKGEKPTNTVIENMNQLAKEASLLLESIIGRYDNQIVPVIQEAIHKAQLILKDAVTLLQEANSTLPEMQQKFPEIASAITEGMTELKKIQQNFPLIEAKTKALANKIREFEATEDIQEVIELLKNDFKKESDFFAEPVVLKEHKLFPIPNYGSAMSPFFTTLSLWVGALLLVSLLTVEIHDETQRYKSHHVYFGRFLTFVSIALFQALIVTTGDIFILKTYVADKIWFVLFGLFIGTIFMFIVYTLVSVFGNVGKALSIILLVLQISGSGGTFPIQVTPQFFQTINPYLPFTYAISIMREAVGGIIWSVVYNDISKLILFFIIILIIGLLLKKPFNRSSAKFIQKAKESRLLH